MIKELNDLRKQNKDTKILLYMIIHDFKHPTESLISTVAAALTQLTGAKEMLGTIIKQYKKLEKRVKKTFTGKIPNSSLQAIIMDSQQMRPRLGSQFSVLQKDEHPKSEKSEKVI